MNESVFSAVPIVFVLLIVGGLFLIIARLLRLALKVAFAMALVCILVAGAGIAWWQGWFSSSSPSTRRPADSNHRTNTNRQR